MYQNYESNSTWVIEEDMLHLRYKYKMSTAIPHISSIIRVSHINYFSYLI